MRWVVQSNLGNTGDAQRIADACAALGQPCDLLKVIPFSETLPNVPTNEPTLFYGGTNWINAIHKSKLWNPGVFFDEFNFEYRTSLAFYGDMMLNHDARMWTMREFIEVSTEINRPAYELVFIRPNRDAKEFNGEVIAYGEFNNWYNVISGNSFDITPNTMIITAKPVAIQQEWRCFMVNGKVSSASQYRVRGRLDVAAGAPPGVVTLAESLANRWSPAPIFTLDIGNRGNPDLSAADRDLRVIETGCVNSSGFYACDVAKIVTDISALY